MNVLLLLLKERLFITLREPWQNVLRMFPVIFFFSLFAAGLILNIDDFTVLHPCTQLVNVFPSGSDQQRLAHQQLHRFSGRDHKLLVN